MKNLEIGCPIGHRYVTKISTSTAPGHPFKVEVFCKRRKRPKNKKRPS